MRGFGTTLAVLAAAAALAPCTADAQSQIRGVVVEAESGRLVPGAQITLVDRRVRAVTGPDGRFVIGGVPAGAHTLRVARIGFHVNEQRITVEDSASVDLTVRLTTLAVQLRDIVVTPGHFGVLDADLVAQQTLTRDDIDTRPQVGEDVFRAVKRLPGIASGDISTKLNVRGGSDQDLLIRIDGVELYEPYHLKDFDGVLGVIDVQSVGAVDLVTGGLPVEYGDKLVGVFDMTSRTPPLDGTRTALGLSITNVSLMSQGAFAGGNGQWLASARRGYLDIALALTGNDDDLSPRYYDLFGKVQYQLHPNHRLSAHVLHAGDDLDFIEEDDSVQSGWISQYGWLTWQAVPANRITLHTMGFGGRVTRRRIGGVDDAGRIRGPEFVRVDDDRVFRFAGVKHDAVVEFTDRVLLKVGGEAKRVEADYRYFNATRTLILTPAQEIGAQHDTVSVVERPRGSELSAYLATKLRPIPALTAEIGVRYDRISHTNDDDLAPRVHAALEVTPLTTARASWGFYYRSHGVHELDVGDGEAQFFPQDRAEQVALGIDHRFPNDVAARVELYRRTMADQRPRYINAERDVDAFPEAEGDRLRIDPGRGVARGVELLLSRDDGRRWGWSASYVLAVAEDEIDGVWIPRTLDQRHTVGVNVTYRPNSQWQISAAWQYHTGWPATESIFVVDSLADGSLKVSREFGALSDLRLPAYHRLDFRASRNFPVGRGILQAYFDLFNVYNRTNLRSFGYNVNVRDGRLTTFRGTGEELLPILPSLGLRWEF